MRWKTGSRMKGRRLGFGLAACLAVILVSITWIRARPSLETSGRNVFAAMTTGDGRSLIRYALPEEISANNLTAEKISRLYRDLILPRLDVTPDLKPSSVYIQNGLAQLENGKFGVMIVETMNGHRASITTKLLEAWSQDYHRRNKLQWSVESRIDAVIEGVTTDRRALEALGITTLFELDIFSGQVKPIPVATLADEYRKWREQLAKQATAQR